MGCRPSAGAEGHGLSARGRKCRRSAPSEVNRKVSHRLDILGCEDCEHMSRQELVPTTTSARMIVAFPDYWHDVYIDAKPTSYSSTPRVFTSTA
jgi:hypothetical protein